MKKIVFSKSVIPALFVTIKVITYSGVILLWEMLFKKASYSMFMNNWADGMCCSRLVSNVKIVAPPIGKMNKLIQQNSH